MGNSAFNTSYNNMFSGIEIVYSMYKFVVFKTFSEQAPYLPLSTAFVN